MGSGDVGEAGCTYFYLTTPGEDRVLGHREMCLDVYLGCIQLLISFYATSVYIFWEGGGSNISPGSWTSCPQLGFGGNRLRNYP